MSGEVTHCANCGQSVFAAEPHKVGECASPEQAVRERLAQMRALCNAVEAQSEQYPTGPLVERLASVWSMLPTEACYIAAACPDLMLRLVTEAEGVLNRHFVDVGELCACAYRWPCPDARAVLRAWA